MRLSSLSRGALVSGLAATLLVSVPGAAHAEGEVPHDYALTPTVNSHFYTLGETRVDIGEGAPYVTVLGPTTVLSMDWDGEIATTDVVSLESKKLGRLTMPARSRSARSARSRAAATRGSATPPP